MDWKFDHLPMFGFDVVEVDFPWDFELYSEAGEEKSAKAHYETMSIAEIMSYPIDLLARGDCLFLIWHPEWLKPGIIDALLKNWSLDFRSRMIWRKLTRNGKPAMGPGYRVRTLHEPVMICTTGNPKHKAFPSVFDGVRRQHSRKPEEFYKMVDRRCPNTFKASLFSRQSRPGWATWGREATKFDGDPIALPPTVEPEIIIPPLGGLFAGVPNGT